MFIAVISTACVTMTVTCLTCGNSRIVDDSHLFLRLDMQLEVSVVCRHVATYWLKIARFYNPTRMFSALARGDPVWISGNCSILIKIEWLSYRVVKKLSRNVKRFSQNTGTQRTDRRSELLYQYRALKTLLQFAQCTAVCICVHCVITIRNNKSNAVNVVQSGDRNSVQQLLQRQHDVQFLTTECNFQG